MIVVGRDCTYAYPLMDAEDGDVVRGDGRANHGTISSTAISSAGSASGRTVSPGVWVVMDW